MLSVENLHAGYGSSKVLQGINLQVDAGSVVALIGANGAGKTTTMRTISGLLKPTQGRILFNGQAIQRMDAADIARMGLIQAPEGRHVFGPLCVEDNLLLGAYRYLPKFFGYKKRAQSQLDKIYALFPVLQQRATQQAGTLSGGEQQMLVFGRALMADPKIILLDEPSMGLAPVIVQEVFNTIRQLKAAGITLLLVEQFAKRALEVADYAYVMERGQIAIAGVCAQLQQDERVLAAYLG